jgi:hypothetical protein
MTEVDRRRAMSAAEFDAIPVDDEYPIDGYYEAFITRNDLLTDDVYEPERFHELTAGQRMLIQLSAFDNQVKNGGITQFFWNCGDSIFDVADWIEQLGLTELQANYDRALETLVGNKDQWLALRAERSQGGDRPRWGPFQQSYGLLDLGWFDEAYYDKRGYNERQEWVRLSLGLHHSLQMRLVEYIRAHRAQFVRNAD